MGRYLQICVSDKLAVVKINGVVTKPAFDQQFYYEIPITGTAIN